MKRIVRRTSRLARWSRRLAGFALPLIVLPVWLHRTRLLNSTAFQIVFALAVVLAFLAVLLGIAAYVRIWRTGDHGWGKSTFGIVLGLACLSPLAYGAVMASRYPLTNDVTTDPRLPLAMIVHSTAPTRPEGGASFARVQAAFPAARPRLYSSEPEAVFEQVMQLVGQREWDVRVARPVDLSGEGQVNAMAMTFMGWRDEVAIRVTRTLDGARVDMRSASLNGVHDLGVNGRRIEEFLQELDQMVQRKDGDTG